MSEIADRYDPTRVEPHWYGIWEARGYFHAEADSPEKPYCIVIPPANVTGSLHLGHALNNTLQDVLIRYKRMDGYNALWMPGTDHAGIATQYVVERQLAKEGKTKEDLGREGFIARVWQWKEESGGTIIHQLKSLGASCDWARERFTMDPGLSAAVREVFVRLWEEGLIYQGDYIVNWCPRCQTVLSDLEVEREEQDAEFVYIKYGPLTLGTVRPETKLGDTAVAVHPKDKRYKKYVGKTLEVPSVEGNITLRVVADSAVDPKFGTGVIKVTPGHDATDFEIGRRHGLPIRSVIGFDGKMTALAGKYAGLDRFETRKRIVEDMKELGLIDRIEPYRHSVGVCYRCKTVVEPLVSKQWYVRTKPLAEPAIKAVRSGKIKIVPRAWSKTYFHWMENIRDWAISRQLWWGHRIPVWYCDKDGSMHVSRTDLSACPQCGGALRQDTDVLDTWFSSGLWPFSTLGRRGTPSAADRWIKSRLTEATALVRKAIDTYRFNDAASAVYQFLWHEYCDWYLEIAKRSLYQPESPEAKAMTQRTLVETLETTLRLLHPFMPFISEELWQRLPHQGDSIMIAPFPKASRKGRDPEAERLMAPVLDFVSAIRTIRSESRISPAVELAVSVKPAGPEVAAALASGAAVIGSLARAAITVSADGARPANSAMAATPSGDVFVRLEGVVDFEAERQRLRKEVERARKEIAFLEGKLGRPDFVERAPALVVERERARLTEQRQTEQKLAASLAALG